MHLLVCIMSNPTYFFCYCNIYCFNVCSRKGKWVDPPLIPPPKYIMRRETNEQPRDICCGFDFRGNSVKSYLFTK